MWWMSDVIPLSAHMFEKKEDTLLQIHWVDTKAKKLCYGESFMYVVVFNGRRA